MQLQEPVDGDAQVFSPDLIAGKLRTTKGEIASTLGLSRDAIARTTRSSDPKSPDTASAHGGDTEPRGVLQRRSAASGLRAWFRSETLPGFAGKTPNQLVREGNAKHVHAHLDRVMAGGYA